MTRFRIYHRDLRPDPDQGRKALAERNIPKNLSDHRAAASTYRASAALEAAINTALAVGAPLLLTGEPGTGKTQVAFHLAWFFGLDPKDDVFPLYVRSTTTARDLLYELDAVAYFHAANDPRRRNEDISRRDFLTRGPLWNAFERERPSVVLLDEIDKAPRDFPNDILNVLDQKRFWVPEENRWVELLGRPPIIVITSNSERRLPGPFLRRCIFHHIEFTESLVREAVRARGHDFPQLSAPIQDAAVRRFLELRAAGIRKPPATAELLVWLTILNARGVTEAEILNGPLSGLPALSALVKDRDDLALLL